jgi:hypothetical protein
LCTESATWSPPKVHLNKLKPQLSNTSHQVTWAIIQQKKHGLNVMHQGFTEPTTPQVAMLCEITQTPAFLEFFFLNKLCNIFLCPKKNSN